jgi:hypothetical protein
MINPTRVLRSTALGALAAVALLLLSATPGLAAKSAGTGNNSPSSHGGSSTPIGNDLSWPQCGGTFPSGQAFEIVGVNGGLANDPNPCLGSTGTNPATSELHWALTTSSGATSQPRASLYVNTADPGETAGDWPKPGTYSGDPYTDPTGSLGYCNGSNTQACAWEYGYQRAAYDAGLLATAAPAIGVPTSPGSYPWWLDIETANTWQSGSGGPAMNVADIQGMVYYLKMVGGASKVGIYSTQSQWSTIVGTQTLGTTIAELPDWIPGARSLSGAESNCSLRGFTGTVALTQWFGRPFDGDYSCPVL